MFLRCEWIRLQYKYLMQEPCHSFPPVSPEGNADHHKKKENSSHLITLVVEFHSLNIG
jgi:hypothetical protein